MSFGVMVSEKAVAVRVNRLLEAGPMGASAQCNLGYVDRQWHIDPFKPRNGYWKCQGTVAPCANSPNKQACALATYIDIPGCVEFALTRVRQWSGMGPRSLSLTLSCMVQAAVAESVAEQIVG